MSELSIIKGRPAIESTISDQAFARIAKIALREAGIVLAPSKISMVKSRLTRRLRALGMSLSKQELINPRWATSFRR